MTSVRVLRCGGGKDQRFLECFDEPVRCGQVTPQVRHSDDVGLDTIRVSEISVRSEGYVDNAVDVAEVGSAVEIKDRSMGRVQYVHSATWWDFGEFSSA